MKLIQAQKAAKTNIFPDYWTLLYGRRLSDIMIKTLTGTLPLTFTTSETALRAWTIYGNNTQHNYSATGTLPLAVTTHTAGAANDWVIYGNDDNGTEQLFDGNYQAAFIDLSNNKYSALDAGRTAVIQCDPNTQYTISVWSGCNRLVVGEFETEPQINDSANILARYSVTIPQYITITTGANAHYIACYLSNQNNTPTITIVKGSTAPDHYIPYQQGVGEQRVDGYYVPLTVSQTGQPDKTYDIFIGDSPLTEGESVSKQSTGVNLELFEGANTISTTLYNKPSMSIIGLDYVGVGEPTNDGWQIPLTVSDGTNTTTVNVPIDAPLTAGETLTSEQAGVAIPTYVDAENTLSLYPNAAVYGNPEMTITYKGG